MVRKMCLAVCLYFQITCACNSCTRYTRYMDEQNRKKSSVITRDVIRPAEDTEVKDSIWPRKPFFLDSPSTSPRGSGVPGGSGDRGCCSSGSPHRGVRWRGVLGGRPELLSLLTRYSAFIGSPGRKEVTDKRLFDPDRNAKHL